jgi:DNA-binding SARP family transcriptional activator/tetratricopeptide (TPR) repeat protein
LSRDRLLGILWPEGTEERGRHALAQSVYSLRADLGSDAAITGLTEVKLDPAIIGSDVGDFTAALARGDRETAARLYSGPFLDGFYLSDAAAFERWAEEERARLAAAAIAAIEQLALATGELAWRRRLTELDPLRGRYAADYMTALAATGDTTGALTHARAHELKVRRELEAAPEQEVTRLAGRLRAERAKPLAAGAAGPAVLDLPATASTVDSAPPVGRRRAWLASTVVLAVALTGFLLWRSSSSRPGPGLPLLAVGSVRDGAARDSAASGGVLTDMLATSLGRIRGLNVVANSRLLELIPGGIDTVAGTLPEAARRAGAREILEGELAFAPDGGLRFELRRIDLVSGVVRRGYSVRAFDRYAAVDSATASIAEDFGLSAPTKPIAELSTSSPIAYRLYEEGLRAFYQYDVAAASRLMNAALAEDSTFAMAAYYAWRSASGVSERVVTTLRERAVRLAPRAPDRERLLILGRILVPNEDPAALAPAESLAIRFPADPEGQGLFGIVQQVRGNYPAAAAAYLRAVALDSAGSAEPDAVCHACEWLHNLFNLYSAWDSTPAAERAVRSWIRFRPHAPQPLGMLAEIRWRQERWAEADVLLRRADSLSPGVDDYDAQRFRAAIRRGEYDEVGQAAALALADPDRDRRSEARWVWLIALRNQGRLREAMALAADGRIPGGGQLSGASLEPDAIHAAIIAFESGAHATAVRGFRKLAAAANTIPQAGHRARGVTWNLTHAGVAYAAAGDTATVHRLADSIEVIGPRSLFIRSTRLHHFLRGLLLASAGRHAEAVESYRRAEYSRTEGYTRINYEMAKSLLTLGRPVEALAPLQAALRGGIDGANLYITRTELHELLAQAFAAAGIRDSAATHYREVVRAWAKGDPPFQVRRKAAERWLAARSG